MLGAEERRVDRALGLEAWTHRWSVDAVESPGCDVRVGGFTRVVGRPAALLASVQPRNGISYPWDSTVIVMPNARDNFSHSCFRNCSLCDSVP